MQIPVSGLFPTLDFHSVSIKETGSLVYSQHALPQGHVAACALKGLLWARLAGMWSPRTELTKRLRVKNVPVVQEAQA